MVTVPEGTGHIFPCAVEKIASFDRGWLLTAVLVLVGVGVLVEKIASFDRGWLRHAGSDSWRRGNRGENSLV